MLWKHRILTTTCNYSSYLLEEGRVFSQVFGDHIETEKVAIDALPCHCQAVHVLVLLCCLFEQLQTFFSLNTQEKDEGRWETIIQQDLHVGRNKHIKMSRIAAVQPYCFISNHGTNKGTSLHGAGAHCFCSTLTEQTCHGRFICQAELPLVLVKQYEQKTKQKKYVGFFSTV